MAKRLSEACQFVPPWDKGFEAVRDMDGPATHEGHALRAFNDHAVQVEQDRDNWKRMAKDYAALIARLKDAVEADYPGDVYDCKKLSAIRSLLGV